MVGVGGKWTWGESTCEDAAKGKGLVAVIVGEGRGSALRIGRGIIAVG